MTILVEELISKVPRDTERLVKAVRDQERKEFSEALKAECRLTMSFPHGSSAEKSVARVPVHLLPGCPDALKWLELSPEHELAIRLSKFRPALVAAAYGSEQLQDLRGQLGECGALPWPNIKQESLSEVGDWSRALLKWLDAVDPLKSILSFNVDILGTFNYKPYPWDIPDSEPCPAWIELYWGAIGWVADIAGWSVKDLTRVVMAHELAHAYTQSGADIEGRRWHPLAFSDADVLLKESLAQYYTQRVLQQLQDKYPGALAVFQAQLKSQTGPYTDFGQWAGEVSPEAVRRAMLEVRRERLGTLGEFLEKLYIADQSLPDKVIAAGN